MKKKVGARRAAGARHYNPNKLKLSKLRKKRLRRLVQVKEPLVQPLAANECWSMDFMSDSLMDGSKVRVLNVIDDYNRQYLGFDLGRSLTRSSRHSSTG